MEIVAIFDLSTIDLLGEPLLTSTPERFLGLWNVNSKQLINIPRAQICSTALVVRDLPTKSMVLSSKIATISIKNLH